METGGAGGEDHSTNQHEKSDDDEGEVNGDGVVGNEHVGVVIRGWGGWLFDRTPRQQDG
jgi:hypothetical protein